MRGLKINYMGRGHIDRYIYGHRDSMTDPAQSAESVKTVTDSLRDWLRGELKLKLSLLAITILTHYSRLYTVQAEQFELANKS